MGRLGRRDPRYFRARLATRQEECFSASHCALVRLLRWMSQLSAQLSLRPKSKQLLSFYQVATRVGDVYEVTMPSAVLQLFSIFEVLNINVAGIGLPLQCFGLGTYQQQLATTMLAPLMFAAVIVLGFVSRSVCSRGPKRRCVELLEALPWLLMLSFLVFPMVSSAAFRAFSCEPFKNGRECLRADYSVECRTPTHVSEEHDNAKNLALLGVCIYPVGISLFYAGLMWSARCSIMQDRPTRLSKALGFLVRDFVPDYFWWELVEAWKKLILVGFAVLIEPGSVLQISSGFIITLIYMLLVGVA